MFVTVIMSLKRAGMAAPKRAEFIAESSLWQPGGSGLEMLVGTCRVVVRLAD
jgi:hypothetical protein